MSFKILLILIPNILWLFKPRQDNRHDVFSFGKFNDTNLIFQPTSWMNFLSLPSFKFLKDRHDEKSKKLKDEYLEDLRKRGKIALAEKIHAQNLDSDDKENNKIDNKKEIERKGQEENVNQLAEENADKDVEQVQDDDDDDDKNKAKWMERNAWRFAPPPWRDDDPFAIKKSALRGPGK